MPDFESLRGKSLIAHYGRDGTLLDLYAYAVLSEDRDYWRLAYDVIGDHAVSTVWLGLDTSFGRSPEPVIFETMVFGPEGEECRRYTSEAAALAGHAETVTLLRATVNDQ